MIIPSGWTICDRRVIEAVFRRINDRFDLGAFDVAD